MEKQITIIIPTYNMENYIAKCLDSLLIPQLEQIEVLVVNDGSKDKSSEIAHQYQDKYPDSIRVIDKENGNYGSCINTALPQAKGRYIKILDADDTFDTSEFSKFVEKLQLIDADVVLTNHIIVRVDGYVISKTTFNGICEPDKTLSVENAIENILSSYVQMHRIAYKKDVFDRFTYHQTEGISYTDSQWSVIPMAYCNTVIYEDLCVYRYLMGREGQTMSGQEMKKFMSNFFTALVDTVGYYNSYTYSSYGKKLLLSHVTEIHEFVYRNALKNRSEEICKQLKDYDRSLKNVSDDIYTNVANIEWDPAVPFHIFEDLRKKGFPPNYEVPFFKRLELSLRVRLKKFCQ